MKKLALFLLILSFQLTGFSQVCELVSGELVTIEFANFLITNITDNGSDCNIDYTLDYKVNNPSSCGINFQSVVKTDAGSQTTFTIDTDGSWHTQTGTIYNTACTGNSFIQISGGWGHPCTYVGVPWPGVTCASVSYSNSSVPVELIEFKGERNRNKADLFWSTASESNNKLFIIEHSNDGKDFKGVGTRAGAGTSSSLQQYNFTHQQADFAINYYRLKQVDLNGNFEYSETVQVSLKNSIELIDLFPNPTYDEVNYILPSEMTGSFEIYNQTGQLIQSEVNINSTNFISLKPFPIGWYILKFNTNQGGIVHRVFKQ